MQITSLLKPLESKFAQVRADQVMAVFDAIRMFDEQETLLAHCKKVCRCSKTFKIIFCFDFKYGAKQFLYDIS